MTNQRIQHLKDVIFTAETLGSKDKTVKITHEEAKELFALQSESERLKAEREWIGVETGLPEIGQWVLTYVPSIDMICRDQYRHFEGINKNDFVYKGVSHWMPLPTPPKQ